MKGTNAQNKASLMRWREKNKNHFQELARKHAKTAYNKGCYYSYDKVSRYFMKIDPTYFL